MTRLRQHELLRHRRPTRRRARRCASASSRAAPRSASRSRPTTRRRRLNGEPADVLVLIDGSDSSDLGAGARRGQRRRASRGRSTELAERAQREGPSDPHVTRSCSSTRTRAAPTSSSPGLVAILLTFSGTLLAAFAIVRERERGTLEQLMVTPASPVAVVLGKLLPYLVLAFVQLLLVLFLMTVGLPRADPRQPACSCSASRSSTSSRCCRWACSSPRAPARRWRRSSSRRCSCCRRSCSPATSFRSPRSRLPCASSRRSSRRRTSSRSRAASSSAAPSSAISGRSVAALLAIAVVLVAGSTRAFHKTIT